jgi:hypothetical protein
MPGIGVMDKNVSIWFANDADCIPELAASFILWGQKEQLFEKKTMLYKFIMVLYHYHQRLLPLPCIN